MKRFAATTMAAVVMAVVMVLSLAGWALDAQASPVDAPRGDQVTPSEDGSGSPGGGVTGDGSGADGAGGGTGNGSGAPGDGGGSTGGGGAVPAEGPAGVSVPRVMLTGFASTPAEVEAGQDFSVSFTLLNTSPKRRVQNIKVTLSPGEGAAFLPASGSSSLFIRSISSGDQSTQTMSFLSLASLEEKPYEMTLLVEYEDTDANAYQSQETVAVQVKQAIRADTSVPQAMPDVVQVGQDATVAFNIHNRGKTKLYNAKVVVKDGQPVTGDEVFIGTIESGGSGAVDMLVHAEEEMDTPLLLEVTYEDVDGKVTALGKEVPLAVMPMEMLEEDFPGEEFPEEESTGLPLLPLIGVVLLLAVLLVVLLVVRASRRRRRERDDIDSLSMLSDEDPLVPADDPRG